MLQSLQNGVVAHSASSNVRV